MVKTRVIKKLSFVALMLTSVFLLSGCIKNITPLPQEERYKYINQMEEALELETAGEVGTKTYDDGDGVFTRSYMRTTVTSVEAYPIMRERLNDLGLPGACEEGSKELSMVCIIGQVNIEIGRASTEAETTYIIITDPYNGRNQNEEQ